MQWAVKKGEATTDGDWTLKERGYLAFAFVVSGLAAYGVVRIFQTDWSFILASAVFIAAVALMGEGVDAMRRERIKADKAARDAAWERLPVDKVIVTSGNTYKKILCAPSRDHGIGEVLNGIAANA